MEARECRQPIWHLKLLPQADLILQSSNDEDSFEKNNFEKNNSCFPKSLIDRMQNPNFTRFFLPNLKSQFRGKEFIARFGNAFTIS
jgi:hypothetical protein